MILTYGVNMIEECIPEVEEALRLKKGCDIANIRSEIDKRLNELRLLYAELDTKLKQGIQIN